MFNLTNICYILSEYKLGMKNIENTSNSFLFQRNNIEGEARHAHHYSGGVSQCGLWPSRISTTWGLVRNAIFFQPTRELLNQNSVDGDPQQLMFLKFPQRSLMNIKVSETLEL